MNKVLLAFLVVGVVVLAVAAQDTSAKAGSVSGDPSEQSAVPPRFICGQMHPASEGNCTFSCKSKDRPQTSSCIVPPHATSTPAPEYSERARKEHIEGTVLLEVTVTPDGKPADIKVVRSIEPGLDQSAMDAVRQWTFDPATMDGKPVAVRLNIEVNFRLYGGPRSGHLKNH